VGDEGEASLAPTNMIRIAAATEEAERLGEFLDAPAELSVAA
jgi:hypothetical protein